MAERATVAISDDFLTSFAALPKAVQGKVTDFLNKFRNDPSAPGFNYEKIKNCKDKKFFSVRIDDFYRGVVVRQQETGVYLLLWVDEHDKAYSWAENKKCVINDKTGAIQIFDGTAEAPAPASGGPKLFAMIPDKDLMELGLPAEMLPVLRNIGTADEFFAMKEHFPQDAFENLSWLAEGIPLDEVKQLVHPEADGGSHSDDLAAALNRPVTQKSFVVVDGETELEQMLDKPLEKWRVFLHPTQRAIVSRNFSGPARVLGSAGTGKTVVAMHRAKYLASALKGQERVLFTTFTVNLASDIKVNLEKICSKEEMRKIEIINLDTWVKQFVKEHGYTFDIVYNEEVQKIWETVVAENDPEGEFPVSFYIDEYNRVVAAQEILSLESYVRADRSGRGTRLNRKSRLKVWKVIEAYRNALMTKNERDINTAMYECQLLLEKYPYDSQYKHIIVDEGQDLSPNAFRLLRAIAGEEHENDIFIVGDSHQRIYKNRAALSRCSINIRGRSSILRINYRTTDEIRKMAFALLNGVSFDDLDDNTIGDRCQSLTHGEKPRITRYDSTGEEFEAVCGEIEKLLDSGVSASNICVVARTHKLLDDYIRSFTVSGMRCYEIRRSKADERGQDGIRVATMHRVKGLEFQYVFVVAANNNIIPLKSAIDHTDKISEEESLTAEKCLLYVALTRAQKAAYVSGYGKMSPFLQSTGSLGTSQK